MNDPQLTNQNTDLVSKILFGALCMSLIVYGVIIDSGLLGGDQPNLTVSTWPHPETFHISNIPIYMALITGGISLSLFRWMTNSERIKKELRDREESQVKAGLFTLHILCWALNESVGIFGLTGLFLGVPQSHAYSFIAAALALNAFMYPRISSRIPKKRY